MAQIIIVSNRLPFSVRKVDGELTFQPSTGGVATGLLSYINNRKSKWIGWPGIPSEELTDSDKQTITSELEKRHCIPVFLNKRQLEDFYNGYSNSILWPCFHNLHISSSAQHGRWWKTYREVNQIFAQAVFSVSQARGVIWVHDYQLLLLPELLREERPNDHIGFFLHIPFPKHRTFSNLPESKRLLKAMLGANLIGLHTPAYVKNFLDNCEKLTIGIPTDGQVLLGERTVWVTDFPMGIDYEKFAKANKLPAVKAAVKRYKHRYKGYKLIVAIDRLDISKGLVERLQAYRELLARNPKLRGKVIFCMVAAPSRTEVRAYRNLKTRIENLVNEINNKYGTAHWQPVDYINVSIPFEEVTALFQIADVAFIAPLRDGMNLAAKEFVASNSQRGVLVLSNTAGAANELHDALLVNPRKPAAVVESLQQALTMPRGELRGRLRRMRRQLASNTVQTWAASFMKTLQQPLPGTRPRTRTLKGKLQHDLLTDYRQAQKRLLLLDYDGSLVPFVPDYKTAKPPQKLLDTLAKLSADPPNTVVLVSGRSAADLDLWFGSLAIGLVAEHGAVIKKAGNQSWRTLGKSETAWKKIINPLLEKYTELTPRARVEVKPHSLVWHYRTSPSFYAQKYGVTIRRVIKPLLKQYGLQIVQGNKILEVKDPRVSKGMAIEPWLKASYDFILAIGDDLTDEDLFANLPAHAHAIKVGRQRTIAPLRLPSPSDVLKLLKAFTK